MDYERTRSRVQPVVFHRNVGGIGDNHDCGVSVMSHTEGDWNIDNYGHVIHEHGDVVVQGFSLSSSLKAKANSRRIVACINACAGLDTEVLENIVMLGDTLKLRFELLRQELEAKQ